MYLDGKYFLSKDLNEKLKTRRITKWAAEAGESRTNNHGTVKLTGEREKQPDLSLLPV
jgi:hypothetical protein